MTPDLKDLTAVEVARRRRLSRHERVDHERDFVERTLGWLLGEIAASRLSSGAPVTLMFYDFRPRAAYLGSDVDLQGDGAIEGGLHLCNEALTTCKLKTSKLKTTAAHAAAIAQLQMEADTCVTYDPATKKVHIRLRCPPGAQPIPLMITSQLDSGWAQEGLTVITGTIDDFHRVMINPTSLADMLVGAGGPLDNARMVYSDAFYLYLRFAMGIAPDTNFRLTTHVTHVLVKQLAPQRTAMVTCGMGATPTSEIGLASGAGTLPPVDETHVSCITCDEDVPMTQECGVAPNSFRHRHVEAVET